MKHFLGSMLLLCCFALTATGQERKVQNRPYIDLRKFHYGFTIGLHSQGLGLDNNGYIDPETGQQWFADNDRDDLGFTVGVLGEWRLNQFFALRLVPSLYFGNKHVTFREQASGETQTQDIKSTYISIPVSIKFSAPRSTTTAPICWPESTPYTT